MKLLNVVDLEQLSDTEGHCDSLEDSPCDVKIVGLKENAESVKRTQRMQLLALCLASMVSGLNIFKFSSSTYFLSKKLGISEESVELLSSIYFLVHAVFGLFLNFLMKFFGFKTGYVTSTTLYVTGQVLISVGLSRQQPDRSLFLVVFGEILNAAGFAIIIESPPNLEELWHKSSKILIETGFFISMLFGITVKQLVMAILAQDSYRISQVLEKIALYKAGIAFFVLLLAIPIFCSYGESADQYPDLLVAIPPPAASQTLRRFFNAVQLYYMDINFLLVTQAYAINFAVMASQFAFLHNAISHEFSQTNATVYWVQSAFTIAGMVGLLIGAFISKCSFRPKLTGAASMLLSAVNAAIFTLCVTSLKSTNLSILFLATWGITSTAWLANGILQAKEISRLPAVDIPHTACLMTSSIYTVILMVFAGWVKMSFGYLAVGYFFSGLYFLGFIIISVSKDH